MIIYKFIRGKEAFFCVSLFWVFFVFLFRGWGGGFPKLAHQRTHLDEWKWRGTLTEDCKKGKIIKHIKIKKRKIYMFSAVFDDKLGSHLFRLVRDHRA